MKKNMNKQKLIVGLTGEKLAGKGTTASYLAEKHRARIFRFSGVLDDILKRLYLPIERKNQIDLALALREKFGADILARILWRDVQKDDHNLIVVDGMRMPEEGELFGKLENFVLVYITAPMQTRFRRMEGRDEKADEKMMSFEKFKEIEEISPTETSIKILGEAAKLKIENDGTFEELYDQIEKEIVKKYHQ